MPAPVSLGVRALTFLLPGAATPITRDGAQRAAEIELRSRIYGRFQPSWQSRVYDWATEHLGRLLDRVAGATPGGLPGAMVLLLVLVGAVVAVRLRIGPLARADRLTDARVDAATRTAADYRAEAERFAAQRDWAEALRARFRAIVRGLEERGAIDPRPGRTADEVARDAGAVLPELAAELRDAANLFDAVWYGGRRAQAADDARVRAVDDRVRGARLSFATLGR
ncbi:MAG: DUF4129 domain-containing protein [Mycobacteriales bacterium]|nr:DUF4129 domain-containing protein [Frankia sp.]